MGIGTSLCESERIISLHSLLPSGYGVVHFFIKTFYFIPIGLYSKKALCQYTYCGCTMLYGQYQ
jgi:hypothetical protein